MAKRTIVYWADDAPSEAAGPPLWMRGALCKKHPEVSFFPVPGQSPAPAKAVCGRCAVSSECLAFALALGDRLDGIWGGTSHGERRIILRRRRAPLSAGAASARG